MAERTTMRRIPLTLKLPVLVVAAVLLTAVTAAVLAVYIGRRAWREAELQTSAQSVQAYAGAIKFYLDSARSTLETTAQLDDIRDFASAGLVDPALRGLSRSADPRKRRIAALILEQSQILEYVMLLRADGAVYLLEPYDLQARQSRGDRRFAAWFREAMATGRTVVSDLVVSPTTLRPTVVIATPVRDAGGRLLGVWAGSLRLEALSRVGRSAASAGPLPRWGYVTDRRGLVIAHQATPRYVEEQTDFSQVPPVRAALAGQEGTMEFESAAHAARFGAYMPLPGTGWAVAFVTPTQVALAPIDRVTRGMAVASGVLVLVLGLAGVVSAWQIVRPLSRLTEAARTLGTGDLSAHIEDPAADEVGRLGQEFNRMALALAEKEAPRRRHAEELGQANRELEAFSYSVSHDLRTPLRAIDGFSRILLEEHATELAPEAARYLGLVRRNTQQMGQLVDDLLAFSRLSRQPLAVRPVDPAALVRQVLEELGPELDGRAVEMAVTPLPACQADPALLKQVWANLLANALKFTRRRDAARIEVGARTGEGGETVYFVRDNGVGFDMQYAHKLFGVFQRLHPADEYEGTGVGLAIVQRIVHRHGGHVYAEAEVDKGACFSFTLGGTA